MRTRIVTALALLALADVTAGCGAAASTYVKSDTTLGRVVVYRNGIAYFERTADVQGDSLALKVPADKVDDFLKSLTVVDAATGKPAPIAYPTQPTPGASGFVDMSIKLAAGAPHKLRLSYVTEAPSWKPSYRVVLDKDGKVDLHAWAIVDNTSGEDWSSVRLGVGSSSALSFRFDLQSVRLVQRETLQSTDLFALAPPTGGATYDGERRNETRVVGDLADDALAMNDEKEEPAAPPVAAAAPGPASTASVHAAMKAPAVRMGGVGEGYGGGYGRLAGAASHKKADAGTAVTSLAQSLRRSNGPVIVEGYANAGDQDKQGASLERANRLRDQLVRSGIDPARVVAVGRGVQAGHNGGARVVEGPAMPAQPAKGEAQASADAAPADPIGTAHFESGASMTVARGTSAMVSILQQATEGEVVYLFDAESPRGNAQFPFRAVRLRNPTDSMLESGPVTVFGDGRFIGEGLCEPIPARSVAFVPFALDRQVVVERKDGASDAIDRILSVQRGVFSTQIRHTKTTGFTLHNRSGETAVVWVRHTVAAGYDLTAGPERRERVGGAYLFRVEVPANGTQTVSISEATPVYRTTDIRAPEGLDLLRAYVSGPAAQEGPLKEQIAKLVALHRDMVDLEQKIATVHDQQGEYRQRMDELHAQIVTLRVVRSGASLLADLEKKLREIGDRISRATLRVVSLQEQLMVAKVAFQDQVAELTLDAPKPGEALAKGE